jgi:starch phosphorylase
VARELVQGVDLWLNTPRRGEEACGTSGMKASMNGVLNLSVLDGWFDEAYEVSGGWAIGDREPYSEDQDGIHASNIYYLLEKDIVPNFYAHRSGAPSEWNRRVKQCIMNISPLFDARRMVTNYQDRLYNPAHRHAVESSLDHYQSARQRVNWNNKVRQVWDRVNFVDTGASPTGAVTSGHPVAIQTSIDLAGLEADDVRVEAVLGPIGATGHLEDADIVVLKPIGTTGASTLFSREVTPGHTGRLGYAFRISPNHFEDPLTRPCSTLMKWAR